MTITNERTDMRVEDREWRVVCAHFGEPGHEFHKFSKTSDESAEQTVIDRNHKAEMDAQRPERERYMDHQCAPYKAQHRLVAEWVDE